MATKVQSATQTTNMNVLQKLAMARLEFLEANVEKSGKNIKLEFKYFELSDIIPTAIKIFAKVGLVTNIVFDEGKAVMTVWNTDNMEERGIEFVAPYKEAGQVINRDGKEVTTQIQALGATITYLRRYLWMMALDIVEHDEIDETSGLQDQPTEPVHKAPATVEERKEAKKTLTASEDASKEQIDKLKATCKELLSKDGSQEEFISKIAMQTDGFTKLKADQCEALTAKLIEVLKQYA